VAAEAVERFDPEGCNSPEGEWRSREQLLESFGSAATGLREDAAVDRGEPEAVAERKSERAARLGG
jgi:hypothetical protein